MNLLTNGRRLVIAHNPHSSRAAAVKSQVFDKLDAAGYTYTTIEVRQASLQDNVARLSSLIQANDLILSAAGDGSAHAVFHTVIAANQPGVRLGFLAYGNFNDIPHVFNTKESLQDPVAFLKNAVEEQAWPIEVLVNNAPLRSALLYATIGWTAKAAGRFDDPHVRSSIMHGGSGVLKSLVRMGVYYFQSRNHSLLPEFSVNGVQQTKTDLLFANGPAVARLFRNGNQYYKKDVFLFRSLDVRSLVLNIPFLLAGVSGKMKGSEEKVVLCTFESPSQMTIQCDGEVVELKDVMNIEVRKATEPLVILRTK